MNGNVATGGRRRTFWLTLLSGAVLVAILCALGTWQAKRLAWKQGLLATIEERVHAPPLPLDEVMRRFEASGDIEYQPVRLEGEFVHAGERHFLATWRGAAGFFVYSPFRLDDGAFVFVNRGFVPYDRKEPATRREGQIEGRTEITGLAREPLAQKPSSLVPENNPDKNVFYWKDRDEMTSTAGLPRDASIVPFFVDASDAPNPGGFPVGGVTITDLPNSHLQYAMTWYGLALALAVVLGVFLWREGRQNDPRP